MARTDHHTLIGEFASRHYTRIFKIVRRAFQNASADDVREQIQECLLKMLELQDRLPAPEAMPAYLIRCVRNGVIDTLRRAKHEVNPGDPIDDGESGPVHPLHTLVDPDTPETLTAERRLIECIKSSIKDMPTQSKNARIALAMRILEGASIEEIAIVLGTSQQAVRKLLSEQMVKLRVLAVQCLARQAGVASTQERT